MRVGTPNFVGSRLREAREARGLSVTALAGLLPGVSKQSISAYELQQATPHPDHAVKIADLLNLPLAFFFEPGSFEDTNPIYWRSLAAATKGARSSVKRRYGWLRRIVAYLSEFIDFPSLKLPPPLDATDPVEISASIVETAAKNARRFFGLGNGPIENMTWLLENHGAMVAYCDFDAASLDSFSQNGSDGHAYIILNSDHGTAVRFRFDLAHELGHLVLHQKIEATLANSSTRNPLMEKQAHAFAREFLMPSEAFAKSFRIPTIDGLKLTKQIWKTSMQSCLMQARYLGLVTDIQEQRIWRALASRGWRQNEPLDDVIPREEPELLRSAFNAALSSGRATEEMLNALPFRGNEIEELCGLRPRTLTPEDSKSGPSEKALPKKLSPGARRDRGAEVLVFDRSRRRSQET
ncbi:MAG: XRE family transcriptional regulator [Candidatus Cybelea sp.]